MTADICLVEADALCLLPTLPDGAVDCVITDMPYPSLKRRRVTQMRPDSSYFVRLDTRNGYTVGHCIDGHIVDAPGAYCLRHNLVYPAQSERCPLCRQAMVRAWREAREADRQTEEVSLLGVALYGLSSCITLALIVWAIGACLR